MVMESEAVGGWEEKVAHGPLLGVVVGQGSGDPGGEVGVGGAALGPHCPTATGTVLETEFQASRRGHWPEMSLIHMLGPPQGFTEPSGRGEVSLQGALPFQPQAFFHHRQQLGEHQASDPAPSTLGSGEG